MKIKLLASFAGTDFALDAGEETDRFSQEEAVNMIQCGYAVPVAKAAVERAVKVAPETRHPLDHDGDGRKGGSKPGAESTRAKGKRK
jgi:hypothetical protein